MGISAFEPGTVVDGLYRIVGTLGDGAMGVVLHAYDEHLQRDVAIKVIRPELLSESLVARFLAEARAMARVRHPHVLPIYSLGEHQGAPYFVTELVRGETVGRWLASRAPGSFPDLVVALKILDQTCQGVAAIHAAGAVHRDLKPGNLLLDAGGNVRIADMGVVYLPGQAGAPRELVGTPEYMAPELIVPSSLVQELLPRADIFSLGCIAFELLTGTLPFSGESPLLQMAANATQETPRASARRSDLSPAFDVVLARALAKRPQERTPGGDALRRELAAAHAGLDEPERILVAEDDPDFRDVLGVVLHQEFPGAVIDRAADGAQALAAFDRARPSIVLLDLNMPHLDGMELTGLLRSRPGGETVPIIVVTAAGGPSEWKQLRAMGADAFLVKPVSLDDLIALMRRTLQKRARSASAPPPPRA